MIYYYSRQLEAVRGTDAQFGAKLLARYRASKAGAGGSAHGEPQRRTVKELLIAAERCREACEAEEARRAVEERARKRAAEAKAQAKRLDKLATQQEAAWKRVESLIEETKAKAYDEAVLLLIDLRDLAARKETTSRFRSRLAKLLGRYPTRRALNERVTRSGLIDSLPEKAG